MKMCNEAGAETVDAVHKLIVFRRVTIWAQMALCRRYESKEERGHLALPVFNYDEAYSKPGLYWGREPNSLCLEAIALDSAVAVDRVRKRAIDLGCGEGRDLIQFARYGYESVGVDISLPGLRKAKAWAEEEGFVIRTFRSDLIRLPAEPGIRHSVLKWHPHIPSSTYKA
jgi:SAM-dependent methyltransferase